MANSLTTNLSMLDDEPPKGITCQDFGSTFVWGAGASSYQVEGAYDEGRKSRNNWDVWSLQKPGKIAGGANGCVAIDHYRRFQHDVSLLKKLGVDSYRWEIERRINMEGIKFYNNLIDALIDAKITPCVTIFHFDVPQCLEEEYGGFLDRRILDDFAEYADVCFFHFGDRVKFWTTLNEPWTFAHHGYITGNFPPGHGSTTEHEQSLSTRTAVSHRMPLGVDRRVREGGEDTEPYIVGHNLILAHGRAVQIYRDTYQDVQGGKIGITNMTVWYFKFTDSPEDEAAASRAVDFMWGWFVAPVVTGDYPHEMRKRVHERLPKFTPEEKKMITGSYNFLGMNYYTSNWAAYSPNPPGAPKNYYTDQEVIFHTERNGVPIGKQAGSSWLYNVPCGLYHLIMHTMTCYNNPIIYIMENGWNEATMNTEIDATGKEIKIPKTVTEGLKDKERTEYHNQHISSMWKAKHCHGARVEGYYVWSLFDNYEWAEGYSVRFGLYYVDYLNGLNRYPKDSAKWYMNFLNGKKPLMNQLQGPNPAGELTEYNAASAKKRKAR